MSQFIQLHLLTSYPPANLNRDDLGRPKTAKMGGVDRLRVSSQSLKRTWRVSDLFVDRVTSGVTTCVFGKTLPEKVGIRSKVFATQWVEPYLADQGIEPDVAQHWAKDLCRAFGVMEADENELGQLAQISVVEAKGVEVIADQVVEHITRENTSEAVAELVALIDKRDKKKKSDDVKKANVAITKFLAKEILETGSTCVDIAMFGRMLASTPSYGVEAACQVAHAISVHPVVIEDDYFTAVDDLNDHSEDAGAAHIGETGFAAGLFYSYICINKSLLVDNLNGDEALANRAIKALTEAATKVAPEGKQNSFGSRAYASYVLAEKGEQQPRSLSVAFLKPIDQRLSEDFASDAIAALTEQRQKFDQVYGDCADAHYQLNAVKGDGKLSELLDFVAA